MLQSRRGHHHHPSKEKETEGSFRPRGEQRNGAFSPHGTRPVQILSIDALWASDDWPYLAALAQPVRDVGGERGKLGHLSLARRRRIRAASRARPARGHRWHARARSSSRFSAATRLRALGSAGRAAAKKKRRKVPKVTQAPPRSSPAGGAIQYASRGAPASKGPLRGLGRACRRAASRAALGRGASASQCTSRSATCHTVWASLQSRV